MKTCKRLFASLLVLTLLLFTLPSYAGGPCWGGYHGGYGYHGWGYGGPAAFWTGFGLTCGAVALGTAAAYANPPVYYTNPYPVYAAPVVYQQPQIIYQQAPQVIYQQAPQVVVQAPQQQVQAPVSQSYAEAPAYPVQASPAPKSDASAYDVYFPNGNGTFTLVRLSKTGNGYLGPQGEFYLDHPTVEQLKARYGK